MIRKTVLSVAMAVALGVPAPNAAAKDKDGGSIVETVVVEPGRAETLQQANLISGYAAKTLLHIARARSAIKNKNWPATEKELGEAGAYLELIKEKRPTTKIIDDIDIAKAHLDVEEMDTVAEDLVPIETDLMVVGELVPVELARQKLEKARSAIKKGDKNAARSALVEVADALVYTEVDLPVASTERYLSEARKYMSQDKYEAADRALSNAEEGVVFLSVDMESPIAGARDRVILAMRDYKAKRYEAAEKNLMTAKKWLEVARKIAYQSPAAVNAFETINRLEGEIEEIAVGVKKHENTLAGAIEGALHKLKAMAETEAEKVFIGWKKKQPASDVRAELIKAKQHVAFAENMQFYAHSDPADIFQSLDNAKAELEKAAASGQLNGKAGSELGQVVRELAMIRQNPNQRDVYSRIRSQLSHMMLRGKHQ
jgi:hypothetical protein